MHIFFFQTQKNRNHRVYIVHTQPPNLHCTYSKRNHTSTPIIINIGVAKRNKKQNEMAQQNRKHNQF